MTPGQNEAAAGGLGTIELGGTTYLVGQPTGADFATLRAYLAKYLASPFEAISQQLRHLTPADRAVAICEATKLSAGGGAEMTEEFIRGQILQPHGAAFLTWLMVRKAHPAVTLESLRPHFTEDSTVPILADLQRAAGLEAADPGKATGQPGSPSGGGAIRLASTGS